MLIDFVSAHLDKTGYPQSKDYRYNAGPVYDQSSSKKEILSHGNQDSASQIKDDHASDGSGLKAKGQALSSSIKPEKEFKKGSHHSNNGSEQMNMKQSSNLERTVDGDHQESHSLAAEDSSQSMLPNEVISIFFRGLLFHRIIFLI